ncbi:MAG: D-alanyl-D-alanine carboxypeptidase/D-alanyl-D-alanine-endopeptidase [Candidatus Symbiothrix sp.]|jgi:D-alanyl-D-alanine carboxypeptidase/D-alanyl-D-alanine-endopeptidase (penicillin-binding protein 4)|nr:D-alanyl-D-alanine carboxypeptidase/D-alanyl-D-alanine-endopeptidase [Candidatus Symbiothrix sp.]
MKYYFTLVLLCWVCCLSAQTKNRTINRFLQTEGFENASIGLCVMNSSGKVVWAYNRNTALTPASILKVVTTATALEILGENYRYPTTLAAAGDTLFIIGSGDPTLGSQFLNASSTAFLDKCLPKIQKNLPQLSTIIIDESCFGEEGLSERWIRQDIGSYYAPASYGISIFDDTYRLHLNTQKTDSAGHPEIMEMQPKIPQLKFHNRLTINRSRQGNAYIFNNPMSFDAVLSGDLPAGKADFVLKGAIPDPGQILGGLLSDTLQKIGYSAPVIQTIITANKNIKSQYKAFYTYYSPKLNDIIRVINEQSNNHYSEHLIRTLGKSSSDTTLAAGITSVKKLWKQRRFDTQGLFMFDGSGLSPSNAVSPDLMCRILHYMQSESQYRKSFIASLPQAGKEGSVSNVLKNKRLKGKLVMKSGSIMGVQCFAGYYIKGAEIRSFAVMVNRFTCSRQETVAAIEKLLLGILPKNFEKGKR